MAKRKYEEILADLEDEGIGESLLDELKAFGGSKLREQAEKLPDLERQLAEANAKVEKLEAAPARRKAFEEYGIDFENLSKAEAAIIEKYEGELDAEAIGKLAEEFELPVIQGAGEGDAEGEPQAAKQVGQALSGKVKTGRLTITPEDTQEWDTQRLIEFHKEHPDEYEALKRGETVTGIAG